MYNILSVYSEQVIELLSMPRHNNFSHNLQMARPFKLVIEI